MIQTVLSRFGWFVSLVLLQVLVFNHIHILGYATPLPYIYFLIILPGETPRWVFVTLGFVLGLIIDLFTNTPGMAACAGCLTGLFVPILLRAFRPSDADDEKYSPSARTMKWFGFMKFAFFTVLIHCTAFFMIESFTFFRFPDLLLHIIGSVLLTGLIVWAMEGIRMR